jgi:hypothetical protein
MRNLIEALINRLPMDFRILLRQFLLRVVDLEALSIQADVTGFLGQFAGVLLMLSLVHSVVTYVGYIIQTTAADRVSFCLHMEHYFIANMMLVTGLITVISWDSTFPDRRDVMILSPLPVAPQTILCAKVAASLAVLGIAILTLNVSSGILLPLLVGSMHGSDSLVHSYRGQRLPLRLSAHHSGIHRAPAAAPHLLARFRLPSARRIWSIPRRVFRSAFDHDSFRARRHEQSLDTCQFADLLVLRAIQSVERYATRPIWLARNSRLGGAGARRMWGSGLIDSLLPAHDEKDG